MSRAGRCHILRIETEGPDQFDRWRYPIVFTLSSAAGRRGIQLLGRVGDEAVELLHVGDAGVVVRLVDDLHDLVAVEAGVVLVRNGHCEEADDEDQVEDGHEDDERQGGLDLAAVRFVQHLGIPPCGVVRLQRLQVRDDDHLQSLLGSSDGQTEAFRALTQSLLVGLLLDPGDEFLIFHDECPSDVSYLSSRHGISGVADPILRACPKTYRRTAYSAVNRVAMIVPCLKSASVSEKTSQKLTKPPSSRSVVVSTSHVHLLSAVSGFRLFDRRDLVRLVPRGARFDSKCQKTKSPKRKS